MRSVTPSIESAVSRLAPGFRALSIVVESAPVADPAVAEQALAEACLAVQQDDVPWAQAHLAAWDEAFSAFGAKAKRTPCSAQALRKRVLKEGSLPAIDPVVDIYNAISIRYAVPVGGENLAAYRARLRFNERAAAELLEQAAALMAQAKSCHDELETYYRSAVDFAKVDEAAEQCKKLFGVE